MSNNSRKPTPESILEANMKGFLDSFQKYADTYTKVQGKKRVDIQIDREASFEQIQKSSVVTSSDVKKILDFLVNHPEFNDQTGKFFDPCIELLQQCISIERQNSEPVSSIIETQNTPATHTMADYWPKDK